MIPLLNDEVVSVVETDVSSVLVDRSVDRLVTSVVKAVDRRHGYASAHWTIPTYHGSFNGVGSDCEGGSLIGETAMGDSALISRERSMEGCFSARVRWRASAPNSYSRKRWRGYGYYVSWNIDSPFRSNMNYMRSRHRGNPLPDRRYTVVVLGSSTSQWRSTYFLRRYRVRLIPANENNDSDVWCYRWPRGLFLTEGARAVSDFRNSSTNRSWCFLAHEDDKNLHPRESGRRLYRKSWRLSCPTNRMSACEEEKALFFQFTLLYKEYSNY